MINQKKCVPCEGGIPPLTEKEINKFLIELEDGWQVNENKKIKRNIYLIIIIMQLFLVIKLRIYLKKKVTILLYILIIKKLLLFYSLIK